MSREALPGKSRWLARALALALVLACVAATSVARADKPAGLTAQTLKLPSGPASLNGLGESFSPNISTGTGSYSVPFSLPPGFLAPSLALQYTGGKGQGVAGLGFDLPVLQIYRTRDKGAPDFDEDDRFAVSGPGLNDELVLVDKATRTYRLKNEGAYALFVRNAKADTWTVRFPSGQTAELGLKRSLGDLGDREFANGRAYRWFISEQHDRFEREHKTEYLYETDQGRLYLTEIRYHQLAGKEDEFQNRVVLGYDKARPDQLVDYSYGARKLTRWRLQTVTVLHESKPLRTYALTYQTGRWASLLDSVVMTGKTGADVLPVLSFGYASDAPSPGELVGVRNAPPLESLLDGYGELEDVNADGLPDLLVGEADNYHYYPNLDGKSFGPRKRVERRSPDRRLGEGGALLVDVDGDGFRDLLHPQEHGYRYYPGGGVAGGKFLGYGSPKTLTTQASAFDLVGPATKLTDLDSDGRIDLLWQRPGRDAAVLNGKDGVLRETVIDELPLDVDFDDPRVELADFNGDGELDFVRSDFSYSGSRMRVWYGLGHGRYTAEQSLRRVPKGDPQEFHLRDIDHDGQADLLRISGTWATYYLNRGDGSFDSGAGRGVAGLPSETEIQKLLFADLNGNGTQDLVFITGDHQLKYFDLMVGATPGLLTEVDNGMGLVTTIYYRMSTEYAAEAREANRPWVYPMPLAVPVISEITTTDSFDLLGFDATETSTTYDYRDGYYDGPEREFRGFETVTTTSWGEDDPRLKLPPYPQPPPKLLHPSLVTETRMHVGRNRTTGADEEILKGKAYLALTRDLSGTLFAAAETKWEMRALCQEDLGLDGSPVLPECGPLQVPTGEVAQTADLRDKKDGLVMLGVTTETLTATYEGTNRPRFTASKTTFDAAWGQAQTTFNYGEVAYGDYEPGDGVDLRLMKPKGNDDQVKVAAYFNSATDWLIGLPTESRLQDLNGNDYDRTRTTYDQGSYDQSGTFSGASDGLVTKVERYSPEEKRWIPSQQTTYTGDGQPELQQDALGNLVSLGYDAETGFFATSESVLVSDQNEWLTFTATYDTAYGAIKKAWDPNGEERSFAYDGLGRLEAAYDPINGTTAVSKFTYKYGDSVRPVSTTTVETLQEGSTYGVSLIYSDGAGRTRLTKQQAESTHGYIASGWVELSRRGKPIRVHEPWSSPTAEMNVPKPSVGVFTETELDALGRPRFVRPPNTRTLAGEEALTNTQIETRYYPFETHAFTEKESSLGKLLHPVVTKLDGLGRPVSVEKSTGEGSSLQTYLWQVEYDTRGQITTFTDPLKIARRYTYDGLGRLARLYDPNLCPQAKDATECLRYEYDDLDRLTQRTDALGQVQEWQYGKAGRLLHHFVKPAANTPGYQYDLHYDAPADDTPLTAPGAAHLLGQLAWVEHPFGTEHYAYDANGRPSEEAHTLWDPKKAAFETQQESQGRDTFRRKFAYRADGLPTRLESVGGFLLTSEYNERSGLRRLTAAVGGTSRDVLSNIEYDARGLDVKTDLGNQNRVCKAYDRRGQLTGLLAGRQDEITCGNANTISAPGDVGTDGLGHHHLQYTRSHDGLIERITDLSGHVGAGGNQSTPDGPPRLDASYTYDSLQQLTSATDADGTTITYQYDLIQNLVGRFATDQKGERIAALGLPDGEFTYGENAGPNAITSAGCGKSKTPGTRCEEFQYDAAGQMKHYHGYDLHFDAEGRLTEAQNTDTGQRLQYFYDAWGERRLVLLHRRGKPVETHRFVFPEYQERDGERVWHAGGGGAATEIIESEGVKVDLFLLGEIAAWKSGERTRPKPLPAEYEALTYEEALKGYETGKRVGGKKTVWRYVTTDHLGGATHVTDSAGDLVSWQGFEAYGKTRDRQGQAFLRGYIGTEVEPDLDLGLIRMGARYYAPELGRWVSPDPLIGQDPKLMAGRVLESGLYAYALNNPVMAKDPTGLTCGENETCVSADGTEVLESAPAEAQPVAQIVRTQQHGSTILQIQGGQPEVRKRSSSQTFTDTAVAADSASSTDVTVNGTQFEPATCYVYGTCTPQGQVIANGVVVGGRSSPGGFYAAYSGGAWSFGQGDPPSGADFALGGGVPLLINGLRYDSTNAYGPGAPAGLPTTGDAGPGNQYLTQRSSKAFTAIQSKYGAGVGLPVLAYDRDTGVVIILVQPDGNSGGLDPRGIRDLLIQMGADDAIAFDGSNSSTLVVDQDVVVSPSFYKDRAIPFGLTIRVPQ